MQKLFKFTSGLFVLVVLTGCTVNVTNNTSNNDSDGDVKQQEQDGIKLEYEYLGDNNWRYMLSADLPTPCHTLDHDVLVMESYPEQVRVTAEIKEAENDGDEVQVCIQVISPTTASGNFSASEQATVTLEVN